MKPDYKHFGEIIRKARDSTLSKDFYSPSDVIYENVARAVIEEYDRMRMAEVGEGHPKDFCAVTESAPVGKLTDEQLVTEQTIEVLSNEIDTLRVKLAAAEKRLGELAKLPEKWRKDEAWMTDDNSFQSGRKGQMRLCVEEIEAALSPAPTAEELSRAEFTKAFLAEFPGATTPIDERYFRIWQAARAAKEGKA